MPSQPLRCPQESVFIDGFARIRAELDLPTSFRPEVLAEAQAVAERGPTLPPGVPQSTLPDRRDIEFLTVDPPGSLDLDQAYAAQRRGSGYRVFYAIADVAAFVAPGGAIDTEALDRAVTLYSPDIRTALHPTVLSEGIASLLAGQDRQALLWTIDLDAEGRLETAHVERALVRSREQLDYRTAQERIDTNSSPEDSLSLLSVIGRLRQNREAERGAVSLSLPSQEVTELSSGGYGLEYDETIPVENWNAQISLLTGIAAAKIMIDGGVGILRTLPKPYNRTVRSIRQSALALGVDWPKDMSYADRIRGLDGNEPRYAALLTQAARALRGAGYVAFDGELPEMRSHSAIAAEYAHVTAPLRRVADRFANEVLLALCADREPPEWATETLAEIPRAMGRGTQRDRSLEKAIVDFVEAIVLEPRVGETFSAVVVDVDADAGRSKVQLRDPAVVARLQRGDLELGAEVTLELTAANPDQRSIVFAVI